MLTGVEIGYSAQVAICAFVFLLLTEPGHIFSFYGRFLQRMEWKISPAVWNPIGGCERCFSGQVGFWIGASMFGLSLKVIPFTLITIFIFTIIQKWWNN